MNATIKTQRAACDRCGKLHAADDLRPVPRYQREAGQAESLPVPGINFGARLGGSTVYFPDGKVKRMCVDCCKSTIQKSRYCSL